MTSNYRSTPVSYAALARKINSWAIAACVFSMLGAVVFGVIFAVLALFQDQRPARRSWTGHRRPGDIGGLGRRYRVGQRASPLATLTSGRPRWRTRGLGLRPFPLAHSAIPTNRCPRRLAHGWLTDPMGGGMLTPGAGTDCLERLDRLP